MAISFVGANTTYTTSGSYPLTCSVPSGVQNGDILIASYVWAADDQIPNLPAGWTVLVDRQSMGTSNWSVVYRTMATGVTGVSFGQDNDGAKGAIALAAYRGAGFDFAGSVTVRGGSSTDATAAAVTTTSSNSLVVGVFAEKASSQTGATVAGMTERAKYIVGGGGSVSTVIADAAQPTAGSAGPFTATWDVGSTNGAGVAIVLEELGNLPPSANAGPDQTVASGTLVQLAGSGSDSDGTIASYAWVKTAGPSATLSSASAQNPTFTPATPGEYVFQLTVTDDLGATANDSVTIWANGTTGTPSTVISNPGGYSNEGGAASIEEALGDSSDTTYIESPDSPSGDAITVRITPLASGQVTVSVRARASAASPAITMLVELMQGATVIADWADVVGTSFLDYQHTTSEGEAASISDFNDLRVRITATEA